MRPYMSMLSVAAGLLVCLCVVEACNEALCGPQVSKCMLIKCCECDMSDKKNCSCCRDCQICLAKLYTQCCSCVGLCPAPDPDDGAPGVSSVEDLPDPIPDLFSVLTEEEDSLLRWTTHTYSYSLDSLLFKPGTGYTAELNTAVTSADTDNKENKVDVTGVMGVHNCITAFSAECMSMGKCKTFCKSMGAAKYRWFHDYGCCQCVGSSCLDYGLNQPHCLRCPVTPVEQEEEGGFVQDNHVFVEKKKSVLKMEEDDGIKQVPGVFPDSV